MIGHNRARCGVYFDSGSSPEWDERHQKKLQAFEDSGKRGKQDAQSKDYVGLVVNDDDAEVLWQTVQDALDTRYGGTDSGF